MSFQVLGTGHYVPERIVTNDELSTMVDTSDEWITRRVGVRQRHVCTNETTAEMAYQAALQAMEMADTTPDQLDMIICATVSGDNICPPLACSVQMLLGASCPAMDINAACPAFLYTIDTAAGFFARGRVKKMLVVGAERMSRVLDWSDRATCVIFGDGAGAMVLGEGDCYLSSVFYTKGNEETIKIAAYEGMSPFYQNECDKPYVQMEGQETFKFAIGAICRDLQQVIADAGLQESDIAWVVPHQANIRIIESAIRKMNIAPEKFCINIENYGNTSAASIPLLVDELNRAGKLHKGDYLALCSFGGGLASAACILRW